MLAEWLLAGAGVAWLRFVVLDELPPGNDTLLLRLFAHGRTLKLALAELRALPADHMLQQRARPALVAFRFDHHEGLEELDDMNALQAQAIYDEWEQRAERAGQAKLLALQLAQRFGAVPPEVAERIQHAAGDTLERWAARVLTAQSPDDVFA
jgi:hypothetical protein